MNGLYVIAGASGAIGRRLSQQVLQMGGTPLLVGRNADKLAAVNDELGGNCPILADIDFTNPSEAGKKMSTELKGETLKGLAYAVGSISLKSLRGATEADFMDTFSLNVVGAAEAIKGVLPYLKKGGTPEDPAAIVLFSSIAARHGLSNHSIIGSAKAGVEGLTVSLAAELAPSIRVNCVAPSLTRSEMSRGMTENEKMAKAIAKAHPLPRLGDPEDSAMAAAYLLSNQSAWTTGMILPVDGGRSTVLT